MPDWKNKLKFLFEDAANEHKAVQMEKYMRDQFRFLGIDAKTRKELLKDGVGGSWKALNYDEIWEMVFWLYEQEYREYHVAATDLLKIKKSILKKDDLKAVKTLITTHSWWDTVDALAPHALGEILRDDEDFRRVAVMNLLNSDNLWLRRSAIIFQLSYKEHTDNQLLKEVCLQLKEDDEFFIRKAIGWALREYSKIDSAWVRSLLQKEKGFSSLTVREASKYI